MSVVWAKNILSWPMFGKYIDESEAGVVTITQNDDDGDTVVDYQMVYTKDPYGYCHYQELTDDISRLEDMNWIKRCNTSQETVSSIIYP